MDSKKFNKQTLETFISTNYTRLTYDTWASVEKKFFYLNIPKTGCTKIKKMLQALEGLSVPDGVSSIYQRESGTFVKSICDFNIKEQLYLLNSEDVNRICFVRNPYTRLLSGYWNKVAGPKKYGDINKSILKSVLNEDSQRVPNFIEFIQFILKSNKDRLDIHFGVQSKICHFSLIDYNFIGHFENFHEDLLQIFKKLGASQKTLETVSTIENPLINSTQLSSPLLQDLKQGGIGELFFTYFKDDFINFNYEKN